MSNTTLGADFARAFAAKDFERVSQLLHPEVEFRGLTPRRNWEADDAGSVVSDVLSVWLDATDEVESIEYLETDAFADRERIGYRFAVKNPEGRFLFEQQAYISERDGRIGWMRVLCSGFRPRA
ncbi:MAG TPA: hypothetical protein VGG08_04630 [Solirubrobacteraceae bacterium]